MNQALLARQNGLGGGEPIEQRNAEIVLSNVSIHYGGVGRGNKEVEVLRQLDLTIYEGEFVSIVGPSGCGKSTILNLLAGLWSPLDGRVEGTIKAHRRHPDHPIGYVLQRDTLFPWRTLLENVAFGLELKGVPRNRRLETARAWIEKAGLAGFEHVFPHQLSGGMRQRANIIRVLAYEPDIVLMDEPLGALDAQTRMLLQQQILDLWTGSGKTVVFVTHDLEEAILLSTRVVLLTRRPAVVRNIYEVDLPYPRSIMNLKLVPEFRAIYARLWQQLCEDLRSE